MSKKRIVYVIGNGKRDHGYCNWMEVDEMTDDISKSTFCVGLGGSDVSNIYYNQPNSGHLGIDEGTDEIEYKDFQKAIKLGRKIIGICKSSQWGAALAGGAIFQDISHPYQHELVTYDGQRILCNSGHHNMQDVSNLKEGEDYRLLAYCESLSPYHINGFGENIKCEKEAEVVFYPKIKFLSFQNHNEGIYGNPRFSKMIKWSQDILNKFLDDKL